jgi:hypothetical protein
LKSKLTHFLLIITQELNLAQLKLAHPYNINNIPYHIFGQHDNCKPYFCKNQDGTENRVPEIVKLNAWRPIQNGLGRVVDLARSLVEKQTSNSAENFMAICNNYMEGKRKHLAQKYQYKLSAVFAFNKNRFRVTDVYKSTFGTSPATPWKTQHRVAARKRSIKRTRSVARKVLFPEYKSRQGDREYGTDAKRPDLDEVALSLAINDLKTSLTVTEAQQGDIFKATLLQADSEQWRLEREKRITASMAGKIFKLRPSTDATATLNQIFGRVAWIRESYGVRQNKPKVSDSGLRNSSWTRTWICTTKRILRQH